MLWAHLSMEGCIIKCKINVMQKYHQPRESFSGTHTFWTITSCAWRLQTRLCMEAICSRATFIPPLPFGPPEARHIHLQIMLQNPSPLLLSAKGGLRCKCCCVWDQQSWSAVICRTCVSWRWWECWKWVCYHSPVLKTRGTAAKFGVAWKTETILFEGRPYQHLKWSLDPWAASLKPM